MFLGTSSVLSIISHTVASWPARQGQQCSDLRPPFFQTLHTAVITTTLHHCRYHHHHHRNVRHNGHTAATHHGRLCGLRSPRARRWLSTPTDQGRQTRRHRPHTAQGPRQTTRSDGSPGGVGLFQEESHMPMPMSHVEPRHREPAASAGTGPGGPTHAAITR